MSFRIKALIVAAAAAALLVPAKAFASSAGFDVVIGPGTQAPAETQPSDREQESPSQSAAPAETQASGFTRPDSYVIDENRRIADGVYAGSINLGGMTPAQAREAIGEFYSNVADARFSFEASAGTVYDTTLGDLGFRYDDSGVVDEAAYLGQYGLLTKRYITLMDLKYDKVVLPVPCHIDTDTLKSFIRNTIASHDATAKSASITRKDGEFIITPSVTGVVTDIDATAANVINALEGGVRIGMTVEVVSKVDEPAITGEALQSIQNRLGSYTTHYSQSPDGRKNNIKVASGNINGTLIMPGNSFSTSETMKEREPENGYQIATEYLSGESVEAYGGGVCQVATTLYQAALRAELQIDKRYNHSMLVSYVEPSFDAAISWGYKDLVFTNNTGYPIYIAAYADGDELTFNIYGKETRPSNRKITFESVIVERVASETQTVEDPTQPVGFIEKKGSNHDACTSYLVKKIFVDGTLTDTVRFKEDSYIASYETVKVGTLPVEPTDPVPGTDEPGGDQPPAGGDEPDVPADTPSQSEPDEPDEPDDEPVG